MGARQYVPLLGPFLSVDPVAGGNSNDYNYPNDRINFSDLGGDALVDGSYKLPREADESLANEKNEEARRNSRESHRPKNDVGPSPAPDAWTWIGAGITVLAYFADPAATLVIGLADVFHSQLLCLVITDIYLAGVAGARLAGIWNQYVGGPVDTWLTDACNGTVSWVNGSVGSAGGVPPVPVNFCGH